jgi:Fur family ferric uptake transcriptional regulator
MSLDEARKLLHGSGLRRTSCRLPVIQALSGATSPVSHNEVADDLVPLGYDKSTIYRCLTELAEANLVARLDLGDHIWRFELLGEGENGSVDHPHFMCLDCGKVSCLPDVKVKITPTKSAAAGAEITEVLLKGHCAACQGA